MNIIVSLIAILVLFVYSNEAFRLNTQWRSRSMQISMQQEENFGRKCLHGIVAVISSFAIFNTELVNPALAANYGMFGSAASSEYVNPKDAVLNEEFKNSDNVKEGLKTLQQLQQTVSRIKNELQQNSQLDIIPTIDSDLNIGKVRDGLNKYNEAFSEDTQKGTDRLIRAVIQDIVSLERESGLKEGKQRSEVRLNNMIKTIDATQTALNELAAFYPK